MVPSIAAVLERPLSSGIIDKKTVVVMIGLPVGGSLGDSSVGHRKELHIENAPSVPELEGFQNPSVQCGGLSSHRSVFPEMVSVVWTHGRVVVVF